MSTAAVWWRGARPRTLGAGLVPVVLGTAATVIWGAVVGRAGANRPRYKLHAMGALCIVAMLVLMWGFGHTAPGSSQ